MDFDPWRLNVKLKSRRLLQEYAKHLRLSGREIGNRAGLSHSMVSHLMSGRRATCSVRTAHAIEDVLGCPRGLLFEATVSSVSRSNGRAA